MLTNSPPVTRSRLCVDESSEDLLCSESLLGSTGQPAGLEDYLSALLELQCNVRETVKEKRDTLETLRPCSERW